MNLSSDRKKIFIIAGEESGDHLGSKLMRELKTRSNNIDFVGIGGNRMAAEGLQELFSMKEINLMGFLEILPHARKLIKRINETVERITSEKPDIIITIDSPGFNFRVARKLKENNIGIKRVHYVAPSVWAYKPERAAKTASLFDHLICILPFEPPYFEKEGLKTTFIGHPIFEDLSFLNEEEKQKVKQDYNFKDNEKVIAIMPGSRKGEIKRLMPILTDTTKLIGKQLGPVRFYIFPTESHREDVSEYLNNIPNSTIITDQTQRRRLLQVCDAAIAKSGTVTLKVTALGCPSVICYKVNPISAYMIRKMIKIPFVNLVNISANREIIKEYLQEKCTATNLADEIVKLVKSPIYSKEQIDSANIELKKMGLGIEPKPSGKAAETILGLLN